MGIEHYSSATQLGKKFNEHNNRYIVYTFRYSTDILPVPFDANGCLFLNGVSKRVGSSCHLIRCIKYPLVYLLLCDHSPMTFNYFHNASINAGLCLFQITILFLILMEINDSVASIKLSLCMKIMIFCLKVQVQWRKRKSFHNFSLKAWR